MFRAHVLQVVLDGASLIIAPQTFDSYITVILIFTLSLKFYQLSIPEIAPSLLCVPDHCLLLKCHPEEQHALSHKFVKCPKTSTPDNCLPPNRVSARNPTLIVTHCQGSVI